MSTNSDIWNRKALPVVYQFILLYGTEADIRALSIAVDRLIVRLLLTGNIRCSRMECLECFNLI